MDWKNFHNEMKVAMEEEIEAQLQSIGSVKITHLQKTGSMFTGTIAGNGRAPARIKRGTKGFCIVDGERFPVTVESDRGKATVLGLDSEDELIKEAYFIEDKTELTKKTKDAFATMEQSALHKELLNNTPLAPCEEEELIQDEALNQAQCNAVSMALKHSNLMVVGPAGTGKTKTIVATICAMLDKGLRVLVASHANLAVEGAIESLLKTRDFEIGDLVTAIETDSPAVKEYDVVKVSRERKAFLEDERGELETIKHELLKQKATMETSLQPLKHNVRSSDAFIANAQKEINKEEVELLTLKKERQTYKQRIEKLESNKLIALLSSGKRKEELEESLGRVETKIKEKEEFIGDLIADLDRSKRAVSSLGQDLESKTKEMQEVMVKIETVSNRLKEIQKEMKGGVELDLFDTAKVAGVTLMRAALNKRIANAKFDVLIVDEASMATVPNLLLATQAAGKKVVLFGDPQQLPPVALADSYRKSIFDVLGVSEAFKAGTIHPKCVFLDTQFRCHPEIAQLTSNLFYGGLLKNGRVVEGEKKAMYIQNTHRFGGTMTASGSSYVNIAHQKVVMDYVKSALKRGRRSIGVVAPFRPQADAIQALFNRELRKEYPDADFKAATIHSFQGQEKEIVIFDMVVGNSMKDDPIPAMLKGGMSSSAANLLNVATTRARDFFVLVCDLELTHSAIKKQGVGEEESALSQWITAIENLAFGQKKAEAEEANDDDSLTEAVA